MDIFDHINALKDLPSCERIEAINRIKKALHGVSPMAHEPVDCVIWVAAEMVSANDYNPNTVAAPELALLEHSIECDGYTQPVVVMSENTRFTIIDGFHRSRVGRESKSVRERTGGYVPIAIVNAERSARSDRIAATIRHNRARGKHGVTAMSDIVMELYQRNWSDQKIGKELGMDADEVLRLRQIGGLERMFQNEEFSRAWEIDEEALNG